MWKTYDAASTGFRIFRRNILKRKCLSKFVNCFLADSILHMQIVLSHIYISMTHNILCFWHWLIASRHESAVTVPKPIASLFKFGATTSKPNPISAVY